ncbi:hypothetical protein M758_7G147000 [Ceratodon purpureus]|nr:hypothetical protein M758_7G147000 [Ceratodon purpureus]
MRAAIRQTRRGGLYGRIGRIGTGVCNAEEGVTCFVTVLRVVGKFRRWMFRRCDGRRLCSRVRRLGLSCYVEADFGGYGCAFEVEGLETVEIGAILLVKWHMRCDKSVHRNMSPNFLKYFGVVWNFFLNF